MPVPVADGAAILRKIRVKVLHVIPSIGPARGGPSAAVLAMVRALRRDGVEAEIATTNDNGTSLLPVVTDDWIMHDGVRVFFHQRWSPSITAFREFQYSASFTQWFERVLPDYDGVHAHAVFSFLPTRAMTICRRRGKRYVTRPLGQLDPWSLRQKTLKKRLYYALVERRNLRGGAAIHCTSPAEAARVRTLLPDARVAVIPHGIETPAPMPDAAARLRARWGIAADCPVLLFLSRWARKKNIPLLLEALSLMRDERWMLLLAGAADDGYEQDVHLAIGKRGLAERVICPGHVQGDDKSMLLQGADAFVLPSITENFGVAVAEALCCGLPCVVTEGVDIAPAVRELRGGGVCPPEVGPLRAALLGVLHERTDRARLRREAQQRFSWRTAATRLSKLYTEVFTP